MSSPRVIAGKARGIRLQSVPGDITRPVTDRVKEALFNIIGGDIVDASILDLFGGTGAISIEALSRGASYARIIDLHRTAINTIKNNLQITRLSEMADVRLADAFAYLGSTPDRSFDYIYIAPPQYKGMWQHAMNLLDQNSSWLANEAWVIVQIDPLEYEILPLEHLHEFDKRKYGSTLLVFFMLVTNRDHPNEIIN